MKKLSLFCFVLLIPTLIFAGCQKKDSPAEIDSAKLADAMAQNLSFDDQLESIDEDTALSLYTINKKDFTACSVYMGTGATAEEIAVFDASDEKAAGRIAGQFQTRIKDQTEAFQNYVPTELPKLKDAIVSISGNTVVLCVSKDSQQAQKLLDAVYKNNGNIEKAVSAVGAKN